MCAWQSSRFENRPLQTLPIWLIAYQPPLMPRRSDSVSFTCRAVTFVMMIVPVFQRPQWTQPTDMKMASFGDSQRGQSRERDRYLLATVVARLHTWSWELPGAHGSLAPRRTCRPAFHGLAYGPRAGALDENQTPPIPIRSPDSFDVHLTELTDRPSSTSAHRILGSCLISQRPSSRQFEAAQKKTQLGSGARASTFGSSAITLAT
jgi:hypothetical protein